MTAKDRDLINQVITKYRKALKQLSTWQGKMDVREILPLVRESCPLCKVYFGVYGCISCPANSCASSKTFSALISARNILRCKTYRNFTKTKQKLIDAIKARIGYWEKRLKEEK